MYSQNERKHFFGNSGEQCPKLKCKSTNLTEIIELRVDETGEVTRTMKCSDCGEQWLETYGLSRIHPDNGKASDDQPTNDEEGLPASIATYFHGIPPLGGGNRG